MLIILAAPDDHSAAALAQRWHSEHALVMTAADLSSPGWRFHIPGREPSQFCVGRQTYKSAEISGVVTRIAGIREIDLPHIAAEDRAYVAAEMTAFLLAWLSSLPCPVLNRPTPNCLCGPNWRLEKWILLAASLGIPVESVRRTTAVGFVDERKTGATATVVGERCIGVKTSTLSGQALQLARAAEVELLSVHFTSDEPAAQLSDVSLCPDISQTEIGDTMLQHFLARCASA